MPDVDWTICSVYRPSDDSRFPSLEVRFSDDIETVGQLRAFIVEKFGPGTLTFFGSNEIPALTEPDDTPIDDALRDCQFRTPDLGVQILWVSSASFDSSIVPPQQPPTAPVCTARRQLYVRHDEGGDGAAAVRTYHCSLAA